jgi:hypothetical protein
MSGRSLLLILIAGVVLLFSPGGFLGASIQLALVVAAAASVFKDIDKDDGDPI